jgi:protein-disulfide isomerase
MKITKTDLVVVTCVTLVTIVTVGSWAQRLLPRPQVTVPFPAVLLAGGVYVGDSTAPYVLGVWTDYQCPACSRFEQELAVAMSFSPMRGQLG